jgi:hypothetical protein
MRILQIQNGVRTATLSGANGECLTDGWARQAAAREFNAVSGNPLAFIIGIERPDSSYFSNT